MLHYFSIFTVNNENTNWPCCDLFRQSRVLQSGILELCESNFFLPDYSVKYLIEYSGS